MYNRLKRRILSVFTAAACAGTYIYTGFMNGAIAYADDEDVIIAQDTITVDEQSYSLNDGSLSGDDFLREYVQKAFDDSLKTVKNNSVTSDSDYPSYTGGISARSHLTGNDAAVYDALVPLIKNIANGTLNSAEELDITNIFVSYTWADVGLTNDSSDAEKDAKIQEKSAIFPFNIENVHKALLFDHPLELYWYDKTYSSAISCSCIIFTSQDNTGFKFKYTLTFKMKVSKDYSLTGETGTYDLNTEKTRVTSENLNKVSKAISNAKTIAASYSSLSLKDRLEAYKNAICDRVTYNHEAADNDDTPYGDPWQLVYVFDGDDTTNVVCEGYSKAFKYLFDLSGFTNASCILVSGDNHMWNIVNMDDNRNYLVDVTNCDTGSIGAPDNLFLAVPTSGSYSDGYTFVIDALNSITYHYADKTMLSFTEPDLTLSDEVYTGPVVEEEPEAIVKSKSVAFDGMLRLRFKLSINDTLLSDENAYVSFIKNGSEAKRVLLSNGINMDDDTIAFIIDVYAMEYADDICLKVYDGNNKAVLLKNSSGNDITNTGSISSIKSYCEFMLENSASDSMKKLAKAMLDYGTAAKICFRYGNYEELSVSSDVENISLDDLDEFVIQRNETMPIGLDGTRTSVSFDSDNSLRIRFVFNNEANMSLYTYRIDDSNASVSVENGNYYLYVRNILSNKLDTAHKFEISDGTNSHIIWFSALSYAYSLIQNNVEDWDNLGKALYLYNKAANLQFGD